MLLSLLWIARICQFHCLYSPIFNHLNSPPLTHLPLTQHFKPLMHGHIDNINRFRRCAIWHAPDNSEFSIYLVNSGLSLLLISTWIFLISLWLWLRWWQGNPQTWSKRNFFVSEFLLGVGVMTEMIICSFINSKNVIVA